MKMQLLRKVALTKAYSTRVNALQILSLRQLQLIIRKVFMSGKQKKKRLARDSNKQRGDQMELGVNEMSEADAFGTMALSGGCCCCSLLLAG